MVQAFIRRLDGKLSIGKIDGYMGLRYARFTRGGQRS